MPEAAARAFLDSVVYMAPKRCPVCHVALNEVDGPVFCNACVVPSSSTISSYSEPPLPSPRKAKPAKKKAPVKKKPPQKKSVVARKKKKGERPTVWDRILEN